MTRGEIDTLPEVLFSQQTKKQFSRVIGFDLGSSNLHCSLSNNKTPTTATVFDDWTGEKDKKPCFPACIQYKDWSTTTNGNDIKVGFQGLTSENPLDKADFYIPSIKHHVIQWIQQGAQDNKPDASRVLCDFFSATRTPFENAFEKLNEELKKPYEKLKKLYEKALEQKATADAASTTGDVASAPPVPKYYDLDDCRFCFAVPDSLDCKTEYTDLIRKAFVDAGFLKQDDDANRLIFVSDAVAASYSCVHAPQNFSGIEPATNYLVVDLGHDSAKFAVIQAEKTVATSTVLPCLRKSKVAGHRSFKDDFIKFVTQRSDTFGMDITQPEEVDAWADAFETYKTTIDLRQDDGMTEFEVNDKQVHISNRDLKEHVFNPCLDDIFSCVFEHCQTFRVAKVFFRGQFCKEPYFLDTCISFVKDREHSFIRIPTILIWEKKPEYMVSNGAVSYGLRSALVQIPVFVPSDTPTNQADESSKVQEKKASKESNKQPRHLGLPKGHFAVGIDFGTTFSGCSYADISKMEAGEKRDILPIEDWDVGYVYPKVSTALRYNTRSGSFSKLWGYDALKPTLENNEVKLEFFKLLLSPENVERFYGNGNRQIEDVKDQYFMVDQTSTEKKPIKTTKTLTPVDIIAKYLKHLNTKIKEYLTQKTKVPKKKLRLKYVITVPAMWTNTGRATMLEAAIEAGLVKSGEDKYIQLITEPEAAALSCENFMKEAWKLDSESYKDGLIFTVFDAGGGTVDLVTFQQTVEKTDGKEETRIEQIGDGTGDTCGAIYLDKRCREVITDFYTEAMGQRPEKSFIDHHVKYFKENYKEHFMPIDRPDAVYTIPLPPHPRVPQDSKPKPYKESGSPDRPKARCRLVENNSVLEISRAEVQRCIFDPVVDRAVGVLREHLKNTKEHRPSAILLVGGFSQSKYLQYKIKRFCDQEGIPHMSAPPDGVTAISRGAVSYFLDPRLVSRKIASNSYGICVDLATKSNNTSHLCYFIQKGDSIEVEEKLYTKTVSVEYPGSAVIALFAHNEPPGDSKKEYESYTFNDGKKIKKVAEYVVDLPDSPLLSPGTKVDLHVSFKSSIGAASLYIKSVDERIELQTSGQTTENCISFKRIETDSLQVYLNKSGFEGMTLFGISLSRGR